MKVKVAVRIVDDIGVLELDLVAKNVPGQRGWLDGTHRALERPGERIGLGDPDVYGADVVVPLDPVLEMHVVG